LSSECGGNSRLSGGYRYAAGSEAEVLEILNRHARGKVRVVGALHSWSPAIVSEDVLMDLRHFDSVQVQRGTDGTLWVTVGGGCRIKHLLRKLHSLGDATLPSLGLITQQTIAGAISTATHGSGRPSMSHYMAEIRAAAYDAQTGQARVFVWNDGPALWAARCALGCMGIILSVKLRCIPQYAVAENVRRHDSLNEVLAQEAEHPLQQFYLVPHAWVFYAQQRKALRVGPSKRSWHATLYRIYWFLYIDLGLHWCVKLFAAWLRRRRLVHLFYRRLLPWLIWKPRNLVEHSDVALVMKHELFR